MWCQSLLTAFILLPICTSLTIDKMEAEQGLSSMEFQHHIILDQMGAYVMHWTPLEEEIHIEIQVATTGFIGLGFSPSGGMKGADIVLAWVDDFTGKLHVHDRYAIGNMVPFIDELQNIKVAGGYQNDTHTVLRFSRPWNTCDDPQDMKLAGDTVRIIWSYSYKDPVDEMDMGIHDQRGTKSLFLREPRFSLPSFSEDVKSVDFLISNLALPDYQDTVYWCQMYHIPDIASKHHMIGYIPIIQEGNHEEVHHILLNECHLDMSSEIYNQWLTAGGRQCLTASMPASWYYCSHTIIAWAIGSEGEMFPEHVGLPLGKAHGGSDFYMMQVHYDNPKLKKGVVDNSGLRIFYTDKPREIDGGVIMIGSSVSPAMLIPPRQQWNTVGICSGECTEKGLPEEGIKVFQGLLHAHLLGRALSLRQIRNGVELPIHFKDMNYDFNYQQQRVLKEEMVIKPGDTVILECTHDSRRKNKPTFGGESTDDEMCLAYLTYYPKAEISYCVSSPALPTIYGPLGVQDIYQKEKFLRSKHETNSIVDYEAIKAKDKEFLENPAKEFENIDIALGLKRVVVKRPQQYSNQTLYDIVHDANTWRDQSVLKNLQEEMNFGTHNFACSSQNTKRFEGLSNTVRYPDFVRFKPLEEDECSATPQTGYVPYEVSGTKGKESTDVTTSNNKEAESSAAHPTTIVPLTIMVSIGYIWKIITW